MNYRAFKEQVQNFPVIHRQSLDMLSRDDKSLGNQMVRWQKKGLINRLRKGLYILGGNERRINPSRYFVAAQIYAPSYISCETALSYYDMIPERVVEIISVTTRKTMLFENELGRFRYRHLAPSKFIGFINERDEEGLPFFIAEPEKAILDLLFLNAGHFKIIDPDLIDHSFRFQNLETIDIDKIRSYAAMFGNVKLIEVSNILISFVERERV